MLGLAGDHCATHTTQWQKKGFFPPQLFYLLLYLPPASLLYTPNCRLWILGPISLWLSDTVKGLRNCRTPGWKREVMETGLCWDGKLILAKMAICSQTWQVGEKNSDPDRVAGHPATTTAVALHPVAPPCSENARQTQFRSSKIIPFTLPRQRGIIVWPESIEQMENSSCCERF